MDKPGIRIGEVVLSLDEAEETLRAIRAGKIDAVVVEGTGGHEVYTFRDPSHPYRLLVEEMSESAVLTTTDGTICYHNRAFPALLELADVSLAGRPLSELMFDGGELVRLLERTQHGPARAEVQLVGGNGLPLAVQLSATRAFLADVPVCCIVIADLREHQRQEELYKLARIEIEARDRMFSVAAHELRNPIGALQLQTDVLIKHVRGDTFSRDRAAGMVQKLKEQGERLAELVGKLLDVGTLGAGRLELSCELVDLADIVRAATERAADAIQRSGSPLTLALEPAKGVWDRVRIEQVVHNLVTNAAKYGLGRPIHVAIDSDEQTARIIVADQGRGIPPEARERIFRPYERMSGAPGIPGLGLGLYITAEIVKAHGGTIRIDGDLGAGSRFIVELPLAPVH